MDVKALFPSFKTMVMIDLFMIALCVFVAILFVVTLKHLKMRSVSWGIIGVLLGFVLIASLYLYDLYTMTIIARQDAKMQRCVRWCSFMSSIVGGSMLSG